MKSSKSVGKSGIPVKYIKPAVDVISPKVGKLMQNVSFVNH